MRLPPHHEMKPHSPALRAEQFHTKHDRSLDFLDGTPESHQEHCHKSKGTLMSPQQQESAPCATNQLEMGVVPWLQLKRNVNFPQAPQDQASLSYWHVRGTLSLLPQVEWTLGSPHWRQGLICLQ